MKVSEETLQCYLDETRQLIGKINKAPKKYSEILKYLSMTKDNSKILGFSSVYNLYKAIEDIYKALCDDKIVFSENLEQLLKIVCDKISECCNLIQNESPDYDDIDVRPYLLYCDKAVAGEIFDPSHLVKSNESDRWLAEKLKNARARSKEIKGNVNQIVRVPSEKITEIVNLQEEMIARTYIIDNQIAMLKNAIADKDIHSINETYKLLAGDAQNLQNSLLIAHENLMALMQDDAFIKNHQKLYGFFVAANGKKYLIPSEFIHDVICETPLNYETIQGQKIVKYVVESESGQEEDKVVENIPVYYLSSLLPGHAAVNRNITDTILIVDYQSQRIGIIVESVMKFASVIKKSMPYAFNNFASVEGIAFDEKYDMIPILHVPDIMKRFRSLRGYDVKKYEALTKKHVNRILIVDDSETTRQIEKTILLSNNFLVEEAIDGIHAIEMMKQKQFDLILCDDEMPRMNGDILLDNIRRMDNYKNIPVIAMADRPLAKADAFVSKSDFSRETLIQTLKRSLENE
ncbi:MAG: response regulator [Treponema sp.]|nr:response regulator [Treponema sp.]